MPTNLIKPKWSLHDLNNNIEHNLFQDMIVEFNDISGIEIDFYIRDEDIIDSDRLYGEPLYQNILYKGAQRTKMLYEVTEEPTLTTGFGINSEEIIQYGFMPKFTYTRDVSGSSPPKPGDVIQTIWNERSYEIVDVGEEAHIFQLNKLVYEFILKPYRFSEQSQSAMDIETDLGKFQFNDAAITSSNPTSAFGDNTFIESESDNIDSYGDVDTSIYGY
jgi:hypothetical protein